MINKTIVTIITDEINRVISLIGSTATVGDVGTIEITEAGIAYTDGYSINYMWTHRELIPVINFFESCGSKVCWN
jgi:hypothetical protein